MITYRFAKRTDCAAVKCLLCSLDDAFPIPLSQKTDLTTLTDKLLDKGCVYMAMDEALPVGLAGFYANDKVTQTAYVSVLGVLSPYQRRGIAKTLIDGALTYCKENGMKSCCLYTHKTNKGAITLYQKLGFEGSKDPDRPDDILFTKAL